MRHHIKSSLSPFNNKRIVVGISGGIAAYKAIKLIRLLRKSQAEVKVVLTEAATAFVTPLTLQAISGNAVSESLLDPQAENAMGHIELAKWADAIIIAPATADLIARITVGMANDLLTTLILATKAPIWIAPTMNQQMYAQPILQHNLAQLKARGIQIIDPSQGEQACGDIGLGRMAEPQEIFNHLVTHFQPLQDLQELNVVITAGPTREAIDPIRYLSNHSSGKMGFAIAEAFACRGANVTLIAGPVNLPTPAHVRRINVESASQMCQASLTQATQHHIFIGCAAVSDYRMESISAQKIKKQAGQDTLQLNLIKNPDIIATVASLIHQRPFTVGFAAETQNVTNYAQQKLLQKNLDLICANDVSIIGQGLGSDDNALTVFWHEGSCHLPLINKSELAKNLVELILERYHFKRDKDEKN